MSHREQQIAAIVEEIRACQRCVLSRTRELSVPGEGNLYSEIHEPQCAIKEALEEGTIAWSRYKSYLQILNGEEDR